MLKEKLSEKIGEPIAALGMRYTYRGILVEVGEDYFVLSNPYAVESAGLPTAARATTECEIPCDILLPLNIFEVFFQPVWAFNGYEKYQKKNKEAK